MARIVKINTYDRDDYYINIDNITKIVVIKDPNDLQCPETYNIYFVDGSYITDCVFTDEIKRELHLG